jgi:hypothetical protein
LEASLLVTRWISAKALDPLRMNSPIWLTSKTPTLVRTQWCSSLMPEYDIGILYPANSAILAPSAVCIAVNGVDFMVAKIMEDAHHRPSFNRLRAPRTSLLPDSTDGVTERTVSC